MNRCRLAVVISLAFFVGCSDAVPTTGDGAIDTTPAALESSGITFDVPLRGTGSTAIHANVYANSRARNGANVLAVHGFSTTGFEFVPLAQAIFEDRLLGRTVKRFIAIDLPGHGDSNFPTRLPSGVRFGDLTIDDNVGVILDSIGALASRGLAPRVVIAHSAGGLEVQAAQEALLARGSSLAAHGIFGALLLAPVPPHGLPWTMASGEQQTSLVVNDPVLGTYFLTTPEVLIPGFFGTRSGQIVPGAPTPEEVVSMRLIGPEPIAGLLQLVEAPVPLPTGGTTTVPRPTVRAGAFAFHRGTLLTLVSFSEDTAVPASDLGLLYEHLTGDTRDRFYRPVTTPDAVHSMLISNPNGLLDAIRPML